MEIRTGGANKCVLGEQIKNYRKTEGLTQEQVANYLGVSTPAVNKWEKGVSIVKDTTPISQNSRLNNIP